MKKLMLILALIVSSPAAADDVFTALHLLTNCTSKEKARQIMCDAFIKGAVSGLQIGDSITIDDEGDFVRRNPTILCLPDDVRAGLNLKAIIRAQLSEFVRKEPEDLELPAIYAVAKAMSVAFPCPKSN